jgi:peptidyl-prolyl cis-trans isomerase D
MRIVDERVSKQAKQRADELFARLQAGEELGKIATELNQEVKQELAIGRNAINLDNALVSGAFDLSRPVDGKSAYALVAMAGDQYALLRLDNVADADPAAVDAPTREAARNSLAQAMADSSAREFVAALRAGMDIEIAQDRM